MRLEILELIVIIVVVYFVYKLVTDLAKHKSASQDAMTELDGRVSKIEELEARIQVLEKIVTDKNYDLKDQIDKL